MKKIIFGLAFIAFAFANVSAQETETDQQGQEVEEVNEQVREMLEKSKSADKFMMTLSFDNVFHQETNGFKTNWSSRGVGFHFMYDVPFGENSRFSVAPGLGFTHSAYYHNSSMVEDSLGTRFEPIPDFKDDDTYKRHRLAVNFIEIPLELRYRSKPDKKARMWKVAVGAKVGYRLSTATTEVREEEGYKRKFKVKRWQDVNPLRVGPTFRFGYGAFNLFAFYSITGLFKDAAEMDMNHFSIGLTITAF